MSTTKKRHLTFLMLLTALIITAVSCNSKSSDDEMEIVVTPAIVAVKNFYIKANDSVMKNLDSVFFAIDLKTGVIFNADSLPKGTDVTRLIPSITFANSMSKAELSFLKDDEEITTSDYLTNPEDSIDFSYPVKLEVTAADGKNTFTYQIKVNVHAQEPDSLIWTHIESSGLPSTYPDPVAQKTIYHNDMAYCMVMEDLDQHTLEFTLSTCSDLNKGDWNVKPFYPGFAPDVESFTASDNAFYLLDLEGNLYSSEDLETWTSTDENWITIFGNYGESIIGVKMDGGKFLHTMYPSNEDFKEKPVEADFPLYNTSALGLIETQWASQPMAILVGGMIQGGIPSSAVWAFDGQNWVVINEDSLPALEVPMLARYVVYRETKSALRKRRFDIWILFGGWTVDGKMNREVYMSYDNGVSWKLAPETMQLSNKVPDLGGANVIVAGYPLSADLSDAWTPSPFDYDTRSSYTIIGTDITWICPYLYIFGGYKPAPDNSLNTDIYRGVLERLTFTPSI